MVFVCVCVCVYNSYHANDCIRQQTLCICFAFFLHQVHTDVNARFPFTTKLRHTLGLVLLSPTLPQKLCHCALLQGNVFFSLREMLK